MFTTSLRNFDRKTGQCLAAADDASVIHSSGPLGWHAVVAELHRIPADHQPEHFVQTHRLMIHTGPPARFEFREGGGPWQARTLRPGDVSVLAHGSLNEPRWHDTMEFIAIGLDADFVARSFQDAFADAGATLRQVRGEPDPVVKTFGRMIQRELADATFAGTLFADTLALAFARHLLGHYGAGAREPRGALTGAQLARLTEYLHANLAEDVGLEVLAGQARVSPFHFARLFRAATGLSPHQFVLRLRVAHAQQLMRSRRRRTLAEVAAAAGFFDQAHFTKAFRRMVGVTPSAFAAG